MPGTVKKSTYTRGTLSTRTKKQIDSLPEHAQEIYKEAHVNALKHIKKAHIKNLKKDVVVKSKVLNK
jgi:cation transport regulator ChaB